jgi:ATP phosphoribosyltransferase regulatory subunit
MINPIPPGTRDILPDEMRELRQLHAALLEVFERHGYGEVRTPALEYDEVMVQGDSRTAASGYRLFGEQGELLALRSDMTVPIARLAASRFAAAPLPLRFSYIASAYRAVRPQSGQMREFEQAGVELIGSEAPEGTAEVIAVLNDSLNAAGLTRAVIGLGDAGLYPQLLAELGFDQAQTGEALNLLERHDLAGLEVWLEKTGASDLATERRAAVLDLCQLRGGAEVLDRAAATGFAAAAAAAERLRATYEATAARGAAERIQVDFGLVRDLGYYTGEVIEVYDPALGHIIGGGGRYDRLLERFGLDRPAAGFALYVERVHLARAAAEDAQ